MLPFHSATSNAGRFLISRGLIWTFFTAIYLWALKIERVSFLLLDERRYTFDFYIIWIVVLLASNYVIAGIISTPLNNLHWNNSQQQVLKLYHLPPTLKLFGVITASITEELIFRGYLIPRIQLFFEDARYGIVLSALAFSLGHLGYGTMGYILYTLAFGILFGWHYQKYRNIKILIACHFLLDYYLLLF
ncbi:type II CAAX endopeptidase family protein [Mucilaginibacter sp.]|uniref:CPBP family intramembrane glutamic endopeptidase n=1 Tax=Mucilaginibacter sp. TaxID=1882438 RepID=UPI0025F76203|nr:type II CAAX endopeptidase family protein [Mucilaginibacter sp.]